MSATVLYRIAAVVLILFAAGHTYGFLNFKPPTPEGLAVRDGMEKVHFRFGSASLSYSDFYRGFGLFVSVYMLFAAFLSWRLGAMAAAHPQAIGSLGWALFAAQVATIALSCIYFSTPQAVFSGAVAICVGLAAWKV